MSAWARAPTYTKLRLSTAGIVGFPFQIVLHVILNSCVFVPSGRSRQLHEVQSLQNELGKLWNAKILYPSLHFYFFCWTEGIVCKKTLQLGSLSRTQLHQPSLCFLWGEISSFISTFPGNIIINHWLIQEHFTINQQSAIKSRTCIHTAACSISYIDPLQQSFITGPQEKGMKNMGYFFTLQY